MNNAAVELPSVLGDNVGPSGHSSPIITEESPMRISACATSPSGPIIGGLVTSAPNAFTYQSIASAHGVIVRDGVIVCRWDGTASAMSSLLGRGCGDAQDATPGTGR